MRRRMMLDSGAFSVWNKGASIDLKEYIDYCLSYPSISYYVNLDVIPGKPNQKRTVSPDEVERSAKEGWKNYLRMCKHLPAEKVIPVFHQNESVDWLKTYMSHGTPYIGISPANDRTTAEKARWFRSLKPFIFRPDGTARFKTHGFAVTSYDLMSYWEWYSVDSASWKLVAAWGGIYLPQETNEDYDHSKPPIVVGLSPVSPTKQKRNGHIDSMSPLIKTKVIQYLDHLGLPYGKWKMRHVDTGKKKPKEWLWYDRASGSAMEIVEEGVTTSFKIRAVATAAFMREASKVLPIKHLYYAGAPIPDLNVEAKLGKRLLSYEAIGTQKNPKCLLHHLKLKDDGIRW